MTTTMTSLLKCTYAVVGGGIAGVSCCETLASLANPADSIVLISASSVIKQTNNLERITKLLESFSIVEQPCESLEAKSRNVRVKRALVTGIDPDEHLIHCHDGSSVKYEKVCICAGGRPKGLTSDEAKQCVISIRDTETAEELSNRVKTARRIIIVGNGGLATELAYEISGCDVIWVVRHDYINHVFFDPAAAKFLLANLERGHETADGEPIRKPRFTIERSVNMSFDEQWASVPSGALGPDWMTAFNLKGSGTKSVKVIYKSEIETIYTKQQYSDSADNTDFPWYVKLTTGQVYGCDAVISATGVRPNTDVFCHKTNESISIKTNDEGAILVNEHMRASAPDVYAAGDICAVNWPDQKNWFQMKIWPQARQMGIYAAKCMVARSESDILMDFCFELFEHCTSFLGKKIIFLGLYNGQGLEKYELLCRMTPGDEFIKLVIHDGRVRGAVLIGDTDLAETIENLILGEFDVSQYGDQLLDPSIDLADYFD